MNYSIYIDKSQGEIMKTIGDELTQNEYESVSDLVYSLEAIDVFSIEEYIFNIKKKEDMITIHPHHISGYFLPKQIILSPDSASYRIVMADNKLLIGHDVLVIVVNPIYDSRSVEDDMFMEYSDHEYQKLMAVYRRSENKKRKLFKTL
tara:strand:+ start:137 stop:580 length:444 start_codon:yes stop_codon:yes gene_type:complete